MNVVYRAPVIFVFSENTFATSSSISFLIYINLTDMIAFARFRSVSCTKITVVARGEYFEFKNGTEFY